MNGVSERTINWLAVFGIIALSVLAVIFNEQIFSILVLEQTIEFVSKFTINSN
ncbi:hypothetical protein [Vibrio sp. R78045]|uniref:hypothetical protein n=1 Tax=Vibrio sp. R78045 TaxID=3093868 RepID=UPI0036F2E2D9